MSVLEKIAIKKESLKGDPNYTVVKCAFQSVKQLTNEKLSVRDCRNILDFIADNMDITIHELMKSLHEKFISKEAVKLVTSEIDIASKRKKDEMDRDRVQTVLDFDSVDKVSDDKFLREYNGEIIDINFPEIKLNFVGLPIDWDDCNEDAWQYFKARQDELKRQIITEENPFIPEIDTLPEGYTEGAELDEQFEARNDYRVFQQYVANRTGSHESDVEIVE